MDELTIYNLVVRYPSTVDLVREVEQTARAEAIDELEKHIDGLKSIGRFNYESVKGVLKQLKEQK